MENKISDIVKKYRGKMSQEKFAAALADGSEQISRVTVSYWENGVQQPRTDWLLALLKRYASDRSDWRFAFAVDCLRAKSDVFVEIVQLPDVDMETS